MLAPVWHTTPGAERTTAACAQSASLLERSEDVNGMLTPERVDGEPWSQASARLVAFAGALGAECSAPGPAVEARLSDLHDGFHALLALLASSAHRADGEHDTAVLVSD